MFKKVLIVDDSLYMRTVIKDILEENGYEVAGQAATGEEAIELALELRPNYITLDNVLPDMLGSDILKALKSQRIYSKILMISAVGQESVINSCISLGAKDYLVKPFTPEGFMEKLSKI